MRIAILSNTSWYLYNFRLNLMRALVEAGFEVFAIGPEDGYESKIEQTGVKHVKFNISGDGVQPGRELLSLLSLVRIFHKNRINLVLSNTPKGNIYSAIAVLPLSTKTVPNVSGLGRVFIDPSFLTHLVKLLYRVAFYFPKNIFFQNRDDLSLFTQMGLVRSDQSIVLPGSGVDLHRFVTDSISDGSVKRKEGFTFLLLARLLWDKGVGEYVEVARKLHTKYPNLHFQLLGQVEVSNPSAVPLKTVTGWQDEGIVEYLGKTNDVRPYIRGCDCVVLPSYYREGTPRSLLEAAAMGKPVITTNSVGCKNTIDDGLTGFLCAPRNSKDLADKMEKMMLLPEKARREMGMRGREKMEREFDERIVIERYFEVIKEHQKFSGFKQ